MESLFSKSDNVIISGGGGDMSSRVNHHASPRTVCPSVPAYIHTWYKEKKKNRLHYDVLCCLVSTPHRRAMMRATYAQINTRR